MTYVLLMSNILQIPNCVILFVAIFMINLHTSWTRTYKILSHKLSNFCCLVWSSTTSVETYMQIASLSNAWYHKLANIRMYTRFRPSNSTKVRNFIEATRNYFPNLFMQSLFL